MNKCDIGLIGLAVMGENLVMNMESKGFTVAVFNRTTQKVTDFIEGRAKGLNIRGAYSLGELVAMLKKPRRIMLMVKAGQPVDDFIEKLIPLLEADDIIIDGGNSHFPDTIRRTAYVESRGLLYIGAGVSGGEEGALLGPSIMPGGSPAAWPAVKPILQAISAKVEDGSPCCDWVGENGAGHFVKMVHNGIEYGDMQLICEAYQLMRDYLGMTADEMHAVFAEWNKSELDSYLIDITADILAYKDTDGEPLVDKILDTAGQKGTGKWTGIAALEEGVPLTLIGEAVFARCLSAMKEERVT
ncbi:MAG: decarboxylating NADP(+)-dependent phosphogluconate dehydrogenase, partial [Eubacteriales bacterium]|nr:decarboxylating NADP(+)-dependent phosphogluconate dehydrogenase [Eubacteriales bacterium]